MTVRVMIIIYLMQIKTIEVKSLEYLNVVESFCSYKLFQALALSYF